MNDTTDNFLTNEQIHNITHSGRSTQLSHNMFLIKLIYIEQLNERERIAIRLRFHKGWTFKKIAEVFGVSNERARQIVFSGLKTIRYLYPQYRKDLIKD